MKFTCKSVGKLETSQLHGLVLECKELHYTMPKLEQVFYALIVVSYSETEPMLDDPYPDEDGFHIWVDEIKTT